MKKLLVLALMVVGMTTFAQEKDGKGGNRMPDPAKRAEMQAQKMKTDLSLNDEQTTQIKNLLTQQVKDREAKRAEMQALRSSGKELTEDQKKEMRSKMEAERNGMNDQMKKILSPEQFEKWKGNMNARKEKFENNRPQKAMPAGQADQK